jgi:hypothetical protein
MSSATLIGKCVLPTLAFVAVLGSNPTLASDQSTAPLSLEIRALPFQPGIAKPVELSDYEILRNADGSRGNVAGISWRVTLDTIERKKQRNMTLDVSARGFDIFAETLKPKRNKGDKVIMLNGNMWFHKPGLSKPVPISRRQKLMGDASYGDIAATNYAEDYIATRLDDDSVDDEACYVFDLQATNKRATYDRIRYWVSKQRLVGVRSEYFTKSGKLFKSARMRYDHTVDLDTNPRPFLSNISISDELISQDKTFLILENPSLQELPNHTFNLNLLR